MHVKDQTLRKTRTLRFPDLVFFRCHSASRHASPICGIANPVNHSALSVEAMRGLGSKEKWAASIRQLMREKPSATLSRTFQRPCVYPYPSVSDFAGRNSDHGPSKTQTKTQTTPDSVFTRERRNSDHGLSFWEGKTQTMV